MAFGVAFYIGTAALVSSMYLESEAQKAKAEEIRGVRQREAEDITKEDILSGQETKTVSERFKGPERTALTELQDRRNIESLKEVQEDVREGTDPTDTGFAGTSQTFATKREERQAIDAEKAEADRLASARFLSPGQSTLAEQQFIQDLGIENRTRAGNVKGIQQVADATVAGVGLKNQGLITMLKIISYVASAYALTTAPAKAAAQKASEEAYKKAAEKMAEHAVKGTITPAMRESFNQLAAEAGRTASSFAIGSGDVLKNLGASANVAPGAANLAENAAKAFINTPTVGQAAQSAGPSLYDQGLQNLPNTWENRFFENIREYTPADISQTGRSTGAFGENFSTYGVKSPSVDFAGGLAPSAGSLDDEFFRVLLEQERLDEFYNIHGFSPRTTSKGSFDLNPLSSYPKTKAIQQYR